MMEYSDNIDMYASVPNDRDIFDVLEEGVEPEDEINQKTSNLVFKFDESKEEDILDPVLTDKLKDWKGFDAPEGKLKMGIGQSFDTILGVAQKVGGLDMEFFRRITSNKNEN